MITRSSHLTRIKRLFDVHPAVALVGARQVGKTTLAQQFADQFDGPVKRFDLEDPDDLAQLEEPKLALQDRTGLVVLDEIQRLPELFPILRVLIDQKQESLRFLILGNASPELLRQSSESLAGRIAYHTLRGLGLREVSPAKASSLWLRGGFPRALLAPDDRTSFDWRRSFIQTFLERDLPMLGVQIPSRTLHRFWQMLAHYHGQLWNGSELGRAFGVAATTVRRYLDILTASLVIDQLPPWHENIGKRQVKSPKVYLSDPGLLHALLGIADQAQLEASPKVGASWEGFVVREILDLLEVESQDAYFWATHAGAELDLLVVRGARRWGFEIKRTTSPRVTRSMVAAKQALGLSQIEVIHAGQETFMMKPGFRAVAFHRAHKDLEPL